ncbi:MAG: glutamate synthase subunit beta [bacterium]
MGKPTGFMEYKRETPHQRDPEKRVRDWDEFKLPFPEKAARIQGSRCMECGIPFCHTGITFKGMVSGCPLNNLIPEWNDLIYRGRWEEAVKRLLKTNNFPEITGRVCPAPCEGSCTLGMNEPAVTIKANEYQIIEKAFSEGWIKPEPPEKRTGNEVAIVGSGPAGLACADQLNQLGHRVTVYERQDRIGGLLVYGIPNMKLDKEKVLQRRIEIMREEGIDFITGTEVGTDIAAEKLQQEYDSVVLCGGATNPRDLSVPGRNLEGINFAVDFLKASTRHLLEDQKSDNLLSARGKDVIVIGGGDTGTDCVATALRQECASITQFEIMPRPPQEREDDNPWPEWPKTQKTDYGQEEALELQGADPRKYRIMTEEFKGDKQGRVQEVHTVRVNWEQDDSGNYHPVKIPGTEKVWSAQQVLLAMGFLGPEETLARELNLEQDQRSNIKAEYGEFKTDREGIFVAGDMRRGQSLVVNAIDEGRCAAHQVDEYLN